MDKCGKQPKWDRSYRGVTTPEQSWTLMSNIRRRELAPLSHSHVAGSSFRDEDPNITETGFSDGTLGCALTGTLRLTFSLLDDDVDSAEVLGRGAKMAKGLQHSLLGKSAIGLVASASKAFHVGF
jgi:hypothetical protein